MAAKNLRPVPEPQYLDEHHQAICTFAETYFDDDEERDAFVTELMSRRGYRQRTNVSWDPPEPEPEQPRGGQAPARQRPAYFKR